MMRIEHRSLCTVLLCVAVGMAPPLVIAKAVGAETVAAKVLPSERNVHPRWAPKTVTLRHDDVTTIMACRAELTGHLTHQPMPEPRFYPKRGVYGFVDTADNMVFRVRATKPGKYFVAVLCNARRDLLPEITLEVAHDGVRRTVKPEHAQIPPGPSRLTFKRIWMPGTFALAAGQNRISLRLSELPFAQQALAERELERGSIPARDGSFRVLSIELVQPEALEQVRKRAEELRSSTAWMVDGKYGLFTHWSPLCYPLHGDIQTKDCYQQAVLAFDVDAYVDMVEQTGAAWVVFTTSHGPHYWPGPCRTIDRILPGRTCRRDLIGELADALCKRGIRLMLYYHTGCDDRPWAQAAGMYDLDPARYFDNVVALYEEISQRYGKRLASSAVYVDTSPRVLYPLDFPYERLTRAIKSGNPDAIVGYSTDLLPMLTYFADIPAQDGSDWLEGPMPEAWFTGDTYRGLQRCRFLFMDDWIPRRPLNGEFPAPRHAANEYVDFFKQMEANQSPVTVNVLVTQNVTRDQPFVNPGCLEIMRQVRLAIRGK